MLPLLLPAAWSSVCRRLEQPECGSPLQGQRVPVKDSKATNNRKHRYALKDNRSALQGGACESAWGPGTKNHRFASLQLIKLLSAKTHDDVAAGARATWAKPCETELCPRSGRHLSDCVAKDGDSIPSSAATIKSPSSSVSSESAIRTSVNSESAR